ncbi:hypothetical protein OHA72_56425 [Dactylosporangium sp. NBC_01737]|uniref:hypothetical protein n=1 Tax=Dactylosporangium sp. NBC_01737 TaxID=2975959 RepID=UPI002E10C639|nr:hypothetical protein OHA72_56425 [Dactylosporangium sp. NBC_01737]
MPGTAAVTSTFGVTDTGRQPVNPYGDAVAIVHNTDLGLATAGGSIEFGTQRNTSETGARRYGWLGRGATRHGHPGGAGPHGRPALPADR